jgi:hypothetical protein
VRVAGKALSEVLSHPGRWRVLLRSEGMPLAEAAVTSRAS